MKKNENFFTDVIAVVKLIPPGRVTTYGAIARYLGDNRASRMVGWALNSTKNNWDFIPAHRVVNRMGLLSGKIHFRTFELMEELLISEGVMVEDDKVVDFKNVFWDPYKELD